MRRPRRSASSGDVFGSSLADILTTALGCVLLLFMVAVLSMKKTLVDEQRARASAQAQLAETEAER
ncbi:hypothetical protein KKF91_04690, partial [Myxococcota bacterium]|nr:hypothetical protein [Myxococcota bacterium]